ncbi:MAG: hypothetical protein R6U96_18965 [Promethearchaeia archaeon]
MSLNIYRVDERKIYPTDEKELKDDGIYIIVDKHMKRSKIWVWSGPNSSKVNRYFAGVSATKIKSNQQLYGASIEVVESGDEPENFPILSSTTISKPSEQGKSFSLDSEQIPKYEKMQTQQSLRKVEEPTPEPAPEKKIKSNEPKEVKDTEEISAKKVETLLLNVSETLKDVLDQIDEFIEEL